VVTLIDDSPRDHVERPGGRKAQPRWGSGGRTGRVLVRRIGNDQPIREQFAHPRDAGYVTPLITSKTLNVAP
jgi:hypothetical protein